LGYFIVVLPWIGDWPVARHIEDLEIAGFRALAHLHLPFLSDVNLFVGRNNTGKTTLLEAIRLLLSKDLRPRVYELLVDRDEYNLRRSYGSAFRQGEAQHLAYESLFSGRPDLSQLPALSIGSSRDGDNLSISFIWLHPQRGDDASIRYLPSGGPAEDPESVPGLEIIRDGIRGLLPLDRLNRLYTRRLLRDEPQSNVVYLPSSGMAMKDIGELWDSIALTDDEDTVVDALRIIAPTLEKLVMVQPPIPNGHRMLMAKVREFRTPVPFRSLGEGAMHLLSVTLALIRARGGTLLIDEVASGIHYSVQPLLWQLVFKQSAALDIQIFATTHSWDCVKALYQADEEDLFQNASLFRLENRGDHIRAVTFSSEELAIVAEEGFEVR
jgi:hypothetical protein